MIEPARARDAAGGAAITARTIPGLFLAAFLAAFFAFCAPAAAAEGLDGAKLPLALGLPFVGILLSIALGPLVVKEWWHIHYEKAAAFWAVLTLGGLVAVKGLDVAAAALVHNLAIEYLPFILMLLALFTAAGGIAIKGSLKGSPLVNGAILAFGAAIASIIGTTGASMILIRPLIRANEGRRFNAHVVVFFIFLVSNIGGALTPLGDPPLFLGFLHGVDFFWTAKWLWPQTLFAVAVLLVVFFAIDIFFRGAKAPVRPPDPTIPFSVDGPRQRRPHRRRDRRHRRQRNLAPRHRLDSARNADRTAERRARGRDGPRHDHIAAFDESGSPAPRTASTGSRFARSPISSPAFSSPSFR